MRSPRLASAAYDRARRQLSATLDVPSKTVSLVGYAGIVHHGTQLVGDYRTPQCLERSLHIRAVRMRGAHLIDQRVDTTASFLEDRRHLSVDHGHPEVDRVRHPKGAQSPVTPIGCRHGWPGPIFPGR